MCIGNEELQKYCEGEAKDTASIAKHLAECPGCKSKADKYGASLKVVRASLSAGQNIPSEECPEAEWLFLYLQNKLPAAQKESIEKHLAGCLCCRSTIATAGELTEVKDLNAKSVEANVPVSIFWKVFKPSLGLGFAFILALITYNTFIMDYTLPELQALQEEISKERTLESSIGVEAFLSMRLNSEMSVTDIPDVKSIVNLENAKGILSLENEEEQLKDAAFFISFELKNKEEKRGSNLSRLDSLAASINSGIGKAGKYLTSWTGTANAEEDFNEEGLTEALTADKAGQTGKAIEKYTEYLATRGKLYEEKKIRIALLKLGICHQRSGRLPESLINYKELAENAGDTFEGYVAGRLLLSLKQAEKVNKKSEKAFADLLSPEEIFAVACANMKLMNYSKACELFVKIIEMSGAPLPLQDRAKLNLGWCKKQAGSFEDARKAFKEVNGLRLLALYMKADTYREQKMGKEALEEYEEIYQIIKSKYEATVLQMAAFKKSSFSEEEESFLSDASQFQSGYLQLWYLGEPEKAKKSFARVTGEKAVELANYANENLSLKIESEAAKAGEEKAGTLLGDFKQEDPVLPVTANKEKPRKQSMVSKWKTQEEIDKEEFAPIKTEKPKERAKSTPPPLPGGKTTITAAPPQPKVNDRPSEPGTQGGK